MAVTMISLLHSVVLMVMLLSGTTTGQEDNCDLSTCLSRVCGLILTPTQECSRLFINSTADVPMPPDPECSGCFNNLTSTVILDCERTDSAPSNNVVGHLLTLEPTEPDEEQCFERIEATGSTSTLLSGFYIIQLNRFCETNCINRILLQGNNPGDRSLENSLIFFVHKRYLDPDNEDPERTELFVQQSPPFSTTPVYNSESSMFEIVLDDLTVCVESGDYLGMNISNNIEILRTPTSFTGSFFYSSMSDAVSSCPGITSQVLMIRPEGPNSATFVPLLTVEHRSGTVTSTISPTDEDTVSTSALPITSSTSVTTPPVPPSSSSITVIIGAGIGGGLFIAILVTVVILTVICLIFKTRRHKIDRAMSSIMSNHPDLISMSTYGEDYMQTPAHNYDPPMALRGVETVINPMADPDTISHTYHEPSEMNAACARALPHPPTSTTVMNLHYGVGMGSQSFGSLGRPVGGMEPPPQYQDPDELESTPMIQRRKTFKNPLYDTTGEFRTDMPMPQHSMLDADQPPIYDQPKELESPGNRATPTLVISPAGDPYSDPSSQSPSGNQYSLPVSASAQSGLVSFQLPTSNSGATPQQHEYHELEPRTEVVGNGQIYNLLNRQADSSSEDEEQGSLLKSNVHHVVNEPGAYVPNTEERRELIDDHNTLSVETFEAWKKSSYKAKKFFVKTEEFWVPSKTEHVLFDQLNQKKFREIMKDQLKFESHLGQGQFGSVQKARWNYSGGSKEVAVKIMKPSALEDAKVKFIQEAAILGQFFHSNVVKLYGLVTVSSPVMIVMEYMQLGDLLTYLLNNYKPEGAAPPHPKTLLSFCRQIACGMKYLARKHFVHRDLAARNIFVSETLVCKIGDFGMSRNLLDEDYYISHGGIVPVKWTAPEGLNYKKYSTASDVYSYGMALYEIWSLGEKPLADIPQQNVARVTSGGYCQPPPPGTPRKIYHIMVQCWNPEYSKRPSFDEIFEFLNNSDTDLLKWMDEDEARMSTTLSKVLGSPLENGFCLYKDLQKTYNGINPDMII